MKGWSVALRLGRMLLLAAMILAGAGCSGGGVSATVEIGGEEGNVGAGWVTIDETNLAISTIYDSAYLSGEAFVSPTWWRCCSGTAEEISGVTVNWENVTTGAGGKAYQRVVVHFLFSAPIDIDNFWSAGIPLVDGANLIRITAADPAGNIGRTAITINRIPVPPTVVSTFPVANAAGIAIDTALAANFSEAMTASSINAATFILRDGSQNPVPGTVAYTGKTATFNPSVLLAPASLYAATITTGVKDLTGETMANDYSWSFNTGQDYWRPITSGEANPAVVGHTAVWTGTEMLIWRDGVSEKYNPFTDTWAGISAVNAPTPRTGHQAIWTGTEMLVWGGFGDNNWLNNGGRYNPATDTWQPIATAGAPTAGSHFTAVWTGTKMLIWGGRDAGGEILSGSGAGYDPASNTWQPISPDMAPAGRELHTAIWTGSEMIVWGGFDGSTWTNSGAGYDPAVDAWRPLALTNAPMGRDQHIAIWTGTEMIVWGGTGGSVGNPPLNTGGRYDPQTNSWRPTSTVGAPTFGDFRAVWTGKELFVWGILAGTSVNAGARYNPATDSWSEISPTDAPSHGGDFTLIWTGSEMIVWGGYNSDGGGRYVP
jgi:hypothetical protein